MPTEKATINGQVKKSIVLLNHHIPADKAKLWVTATEMRDRLVHCGVHQTLTVDMVVDALRRANKDETLIRKRQFHLISTTSYHQYMQTLMNYLITSVLITGEVDVNSVFI
jgi:hypothetical protein